MTLYIQKVNEYLLDVKKSSGSGGKYIIRFSGQSMQFLAFSFIKIVLRGTNCFNWPYPFLLKINELTDSDEWIAASGLESQVSFSVNINACKVWLHRFTKFGMQWFPGKSSLNDFLMTILLVRAILENARVVLRRFECIRRNDLKIYAIIANSPLVRFLFPGTKLNVGQSSSFLPVVKRRLTNWRNLAVSFEEIQVRLRKNQSCTRILAKSIHKNSTTREPVMLFLREVSLVVFCRLRFW